MSLDAMVWALKRAPVNDPIARLVLIGLADHAHDDGTLAYPSQATLARYARVSDRTVRTKLGDLEDAGLIRRGDQQAVAHYGSHRPVVWDLNLALVEAPTGAPVPAGKSFRPEPDDTSDRKLASDKPSLEPPVPSKGGTSPNGRAQNDKPSPIKAPGPDTGLRPDRCPDHQLDDTAPPCGGCGAARRAHEAALAANAEAFKRRNVEVRRREAELRGEAIRRCGWCDADGYRPGKAGRPGAPCDHTDPALAARAVTAGAAAVRAALASTSA